MISIIIPVYNRPSIIERAIQSVINQTYEDWELIIVDDGSTDNTPQVVAPFLEDKRIKYISQENAGVSKARNLGVHHAKYDYVLFLDSDDQFYSNAVSDVLNTFKNHPEIDFTWGNVNYFDTSCNKIVKSVQWKESYDYKKLFFKSYRIAGVGSGYGLAFKRSSFLKIGGFNEKFKSAVDVELMIRSAKKLKFQPTFKFLVKVNDDGTEKVTKNYTARIKVLNYIIENQRHKIAKKPLSFFIYDKSKCYYNLGNYKVAFNLISQSIWYFPFSFKKLKLLFKIVIKWAM
jgi:glycosyltransferase involved in cell wall biosynthesis